MFRHLLSHLQGGAVQGIKHDMCEYILIKKCNSSLPPCTVQDTVTLDTVRPAQQ